VAFVRRAGKTVTLDLEAHFANLLLAKHVSESSLLSPHCQVGNHSGFLTHCSYSSSSSAIYCRAEPQLHRLSSWTEPPPRPGKTRINSHSPNCKQRWAPSSFPISRPSKASCQRHRHRRVYREARIARDRWLGSRCNFRRNGRRGMGGALKGQAGWNFGESEREGKPQERGPAKTRD
jgi:hypothetical protein